MTFRRSLNQALSPEKFQALRIEYSANGLEFSFFNNGYDSIDRMDCIIFNDLKIYIDLVIFDQEDNRFDLYTKEGQLVKVYLESWQAFNHWRTYSKRDYFKHMAQ